MSALTASPNGTRPEGESPPGEDLLGGLETALRARLDQLAAERVQLVQDHKRKLSRLDGEIVRYNRVLRAIDPNAPTPGPKRGPKPQTRAGGSPVSDAVVQRVARGILALDAQTFTAKDVNEALGMAPDYAANYGGFRVLRFRELIGIAGRSQFNAKIYRVMPECREKLEQIANG